MCSAILALVLFQGLGEIIRQATGVPIPGPVIGMALLLGWLLAGMRAPAELDGAARGLLRYLALLFVPAGVGIVTRLPLVAEQWVAIAAALIGSTAVAILVTATVMHGIERWHSRRDRGGLSAEPAE
jgi:holin-like protein